MGVIPLLVAFAPLLGKWFTGDDDDSSIADKAVDIAKVVTGSFNADEAINKLQGSETLQATFAAQIAANTKQFDAIQRDRADARKNYVNSQKTADVIALRIMRVNLPIAVALVVTQGVMTYFLRDNPALLSTATAASTWIIKHLLDERKDVTGFYLGSALSRETPSKSKF